MALRNQLLDADGWEAIPLKDWTERDARAIADVALGAPTPEAAAFLLKHLAQYQEPRDMLVNAGPSHRPLRQSGNGEGVCCRSPAANIRKTWACKPTCSRPCRDGVQERGGKLDEADRALGRRADRQAAGVEAAGGREVRRRTGGRAEAGK